MSETPEVFVDERSLSREPIELYCTKCGYNLSGTVGNRCSECGQVYDRAALVEWTAGIGQALTAGPSSSTISVLALSLFWPSRLGKLLPPRPDMETARRYSRGIHLLACVLVPFLLMVCLALAGEKSILIRVPFIPLPILVASVTCEALIAIVLAGFVDARAVARPHRYEFWRTLCRCFAGHLLVSVTLGCLLLGGRLLFQHAIWFYAANLAAVGTGLWWWHCLGRAIVARGSPGAARAIAICLIPVIALAGVMLGVGFGMLEGYLAMKLFGFYF